MMRPWSLVLLLLASSPAAAQTPADDSAVDFARDVRPILSNHCFKCHGPAAQRGGVRLDSRDAALKKKAIVPGNLAASKLITLICADDDERMPPAEAGDRLSKAQIETLKKWIAAGAEYRPHWAFQSPTKPTPPAVKNKSWVRNPIDAFLLQKLERAGLTPSPEADRPTLIRRVYLDLLGLLPGPDEVEKFVNDDRPDAYERLVDTLLASSHFGERQARHWLDLARYADSNGYTIDGKRSIWPWRDWVINAFNRDLPFDQFTMEQLAGDLLPNARRDQIVATGFHRNTSFNEEGGTNPEQFRVERTVDRTNTTGAVWLGLTLNCAQCHDHKYDPISQKEYYQLYAFFNSTEEPKLSLPTPDHSKELAELKAEVAKASKPKDVKLTDADFAKRLAELDQETNGGWRNIYAKTAKSEQGAKLESLDDRSVLASGVVGPSDTYTIHSVAPETGTITGIRLEALTHPSLPAKGPGRASNGNFVLNHFQFETDGQPHKFRKAVADHSQPKYDANDVLLNKPDKGWAVNSNKVEERNVDRQAIFFLDRPHPVREGQAFVFTLGFSEVPKGYSLGRFRISVTFASERVLELPFLAQAKLFLPPDKRTPADLKGLRESLVRVAPASAQLKRLRDRIKKIEDNIPTTLVLRELPKSRPTNVQLRGEYLQLGDPVQPGGFASLLPLQISGKFGNRIDLARWLTRPEHPLTSRVTVNRVWQSLFGKGLVETENDFGMQGSLPTHPELLDWLARSFTDDLRWSVKKLHKLIVTSAAYRQASTLRTDLTAKDSRNLLLGRQNRLRLEAESIRDVALSASGLLNRTIGGPGVYPPQPTEVFAFTQNKHPWPESKGPDRYRRGMYTHIWRQSQHPLLTTFDAPDAQTACTRRNRSNTPLQALHLANDPVFVELAEGLGKRILKEAPASDADRVAYAFQVCFARPATASEQERLLEYRRSMKGASEQTAWTRVARVLMNLDEFITRE